VKACVAPATIVIANNGETWTESGTWFATATPFFVESACDVAVTVAVTALGITEGAVYSPLALIVPHGAAVQLETLHVTAVLEVPLTVAVNCCVSVAPR
jgi:hypothetical protein